MFYDKFISLCAEKGISPSAAAEGMGFKRSVVTRWKTGTIPRAVTVAKISQYFDVPVSYFDEPPEDKKTGPPAEHREADRRLDRISYAWRELNEEGRAALLDYVDYLTATPKYIKSDPAPIGKMA